MAPVPALPPPPPAIERQAPAPAPVPAAPFQVQQVQRVVQHRPGVAPMVQYVMAGRPIHTKHHKGRRHASQARRSRARKAQRRK